MIRTEAVTLSSLKGLAYKQKLTAGGAGITIITPDSKAVFSVNKRDGKCVPYGVVDKEVFTAEVTAQVLEATKNLSYKRLGKIIKVYSDNHSDESAVEHEVEDEKADIDVIGSKEYKEVLAQYTDKNDKFSYQLMNKDFIQFAAKSSVVGNMLAENSGVDSIVRYVVKSKVATLANNNGMSDDMLTSFIDTFDSMNTRSAFKELRSNLRGKMSRRKK